MSLTSKEIEFVIAHEQEAYELLKTIAVIPAPSWKEGKRVAFISDWLKKQGAENVEIDEDDNVILKFGCDNSNPIRVFVAHSDVVFQDEDKLPLKEENGKVMCPGVGDDTANIVAMLMAAKYLLNHPVSYGGNGIMIVVNSGEEGLGNLRGTKGLMNRYADRVIEFVSFDAWNGEIANNCVGSHRYKVEILTEGGHSYHDFGNRNAIHYLASIISSLYDMKVPENGRTTYNVGTISGGTSVNTIAQQAEMIYEYRSDSKENLEIMRQHFYKAINYYRAKEVTINVTPMGERPCRGDVDLEKQQMLTQRAAEVVKNHFDVEPKLCSASTDCNIPLSIGIPAVTVGCFYGSGVHTREEYVLKDSLPAGLRIALDMILWGCER